MISPTPAEAMRNLLAPRNIFCQLYPSLKSGEHCLRYLPTLLWYSIALQSQSRPMYVISCRDPRPGCTYYHYPECPLLTSFPSQQKIQSPPSHLSSSLNPATACLTCSLLHTHLHNYIPTTPHTINPSPASTGPP